MMSYRLYSKIHRYHVLLSLESKWERGHPGNVQNEGLSPLTIRDVPDILKDMFKCSWIL